MTEHTITKWIIENPEIANRITNGLAFSEIEEFHFNTEREAKITKDIGSIKIANNNGNTFTIDDIRTCDKKTLIKASRENDDKSSKVSFIVNTKDILGQLAYEN